MTKQDLEKLAQTIPCMVNQACKDEIRFYASTSADAIGHSKFNIVEVGCWLGACTAQLALGLIDADKKEIHIISYDYFKCRGESQIEKAAKFGIRLQTGKEYLSLFSDMLDKFVVKLTPKAGEIKSITWNAKNKIGLYIDDACKKKEAFDHSVKTFYPAFIPNKTIVMLLDYFYYEQKPGKGYDYQKNWMDKHKDNFQFLKRIPDSVNAVFLYKGGLNG